MNILRKFCLATVMMLTLGAAQLLDAAPRKHVVEPGQTLYRIAKYYGVTVEAILKANPNIKETSVPAGTSLTIPDATQTPDKSIALTLQEETARNNKSKDNSKDKVNSKSKESKSKDNGAKTSAMPQTAPAKPTQPAKPVQPTTPAPVATPAPKVSRGGTDEFGQSMVWSTQGDAHWTDGVLNLAVIMPFNLSAKAEADLQKQMKSIEFYQGVLMAVDNVQAQGRRVAVQTYDLGTTSLFSILADPKLLSADFIIAPTEEKEMQQVADWGEQHGTPVVSPLVFSSPMLETHSHLLQINTLKSMLYPQLTAELTSRFKDYTVIFVTDDMGDKKVDAYPAQLKQALVAGNLPYRELSYKTPETLMACDSILGLKDEKLLFVPVTPQKESMRRMFSGLQHVKILRESRYQTAILEGKKDAVIPEIAVLGYPEWTQYTHDFIEYYYDLNVYMFSKVYANPFDPEVKNFYTTFKQWYGKEPMTQLIPKYGLLGYDVATYFFSQLSNHGQHLEERIDGQSQDGLQTNFCFDSSVGKGHFNRGFYLVHFTTDSNIEKIAVQ